MLALHRAPAGHGRRHVGPVDQRRRPRPLGTGALTATVSDAATGNATVDGGRVPDRLHRRDGHRDDRPFGRGLRRHGRARDPGAGVIDYACRPGRTPSTSGARTPSATGAPTHPRRFTLDTTGPDGERSHPRPRPRPSGIALAGTASDVATGNGNVDRRRVLRRGHRCQRRGRRAWTSTTRPRREHHGHASPPARPASSPSTPRTPPATGAATRRSPSGSTRRARRRPGVTAAPNPNNGTLGVNSSTPAVRVTASFDDTSAPATAPSPRARASSTPLGADGTGFPFAASDGVFNAVTRTAPRTSRCPRSTCSAWATTPSTSTARTPRATGAHAATTTLVIEKTAPTISSINRDRRHPNGRRRASRSSSRSRRTWSG